MIGLREDNEKTFSVLGNIITQSDVFNEWEKNKSDFHINWKKKLPNAFSNYDQKMLDSLLEEVRKQPIVQINRMRDDLMQIFKSLTVKAEKGFENLLKMSKTLFWMGIGIIAITFIWELVGIVSKLNWKVLAASGGVLGGLGIGTILSAFVRGSMKYIQDSVGNLAQVQIAFLGFIEQLSKLNTVKTNNPEESIRLSELIGTARTETLSDIQKYVEYSESFHEELESIKKRLEKLEVQKKGGEDKTQDGS